ncbi:MAG TPA: Uma2 family endonuclease, partial [Pirellulales bacterium]|jgi:Uma2 family endonuclease
LHQLLAKFLFQKLNEFVESHRLGFVLFAPSPVHLGPDNYRQPDIVYFRPDRINQGQEYPELVDLAMEIVSADAKSQKRDYEEKRMVYAAAGIPEYWIIDPQTQTVTVLALDGKEYRIHGEFKPGAQATSVLLDGFAIDVAALFAAGTSI